MPREAGGNRRPAVFMVATECRGLAKVGGLGDVVRDLSRALDYLGIPVTVLMPYYEKIDCPARYTARFSVPFGQGEWPVEEWEYSLDSVRVSLLRSREFFGADYGHVYIDSLRLGRGPFEDDAKRFAFFSASALESIRRHSMDNRIKAVHCHDWHTGVLLVLLKHSTRYQQLAKTLLTLFTIHNLDYQGTRPFESEEGGDLLSFADWFPALYQELRAGSMLQALRDPHSSVACFNPMRAGINLADKVTTVSPTYARQITEPDDPKRNFFGGRGLEKDLLALRTQNRLRGILNGLAYESHNPAHLDPPFDCDLKGWQDVRDGHRVNLLKGLGQHVQRLSESLGEGFKNRDSVLAKMSAYRTEKWLARPLVVAITRAAHQKISILFDTTDGSVSVLGEMLKRDLSLIILATGELEEYLEQINQWPNGIFICAFDPELAIRLYSSGDLFLMPSDFEPCGISQMIAMRYGCLPLVHDVGGLHDTVQDMQTGFVYSGATRREAGQAFLQTLTRALDCYANHRPKWTEMQEKAMNARFDWESSAKEYVQLYSG